MFVVSPLASVIFTVAPVKSNASPYLIAVLFGCVTIFTLDILSFTIIVCCAVFPSYVNLIICVPLILEKIYKKQIQPLLNKTPMRWALNIPILDSRIYGQVRKKLIDVFGGRFEEVIVGGAPINREVETFLHKIKFPFTVGYGMTECGPIICYEDWLR